MLGYFYEKNPLAWMERARKREEEFEKMRIKNYIDIITAQAKNKKTEFLSVQDQITADAAASHDMGVIRSFPKERYESFFRRHCSVKRLPEVKDYYEYKEKYVNINGVKHIWINRKSKPGYQSVPYCTHIMAAIDNY